MKLLEFFNKVNEAFNPSRRAALWYDPKTKELHKAPTGEHTVWIINNYEEELKNSGVWPIHYGIQKLGLVRMRYWAATSRKSQSELNIQGKSLKVIREALFSFVKNYGLYPDILFVEVGESPAYFQFDHQGVKITNPKHIKSFMRTGKIPRRLGEAFDPILHDIGGGFWYDPAKKEMYPTKGEHVDWLRLHFPKYMRDKIDFEWWNNHLDYGVSLMKYAMHEANFVRMRLHPDLQERRNLYLQGNDFKLLHEALLKFVNKFNIYPDSLILDVIYTPESGHIHKVIDDSNHIKTFIRTGKIPRQLGETFNPAGGAGFWYDHTKKEIHTLAYPYGEHYLWMKKFLPSHIQNEIKDRYDDYDYDYDEAIVDYAMKEYNFSRLRWYRNIRKQMSLDIQGKNLPLIHEAFRGFVKKHNIIPDVLVFDIIHGPDQPMWASDRHTVINNPQHIKTFLKTGKIPQRLGEAWTSFWNEAYMYDSSKDELHDMQGKEHSLWLKQKYPEYGSYDIKDDGEWENYIKADHNKGIIIKDAFLNKGMVRLLYSVGYTKELNIQGKDLLSVRKALAKYVRDIGWNFTVVHIDIDFSIDVRYRTGEYADFVLKNENQIRTFIRTGKIPGKTNESFLSAFKTRRDDYVELYVNPTPSEIKRLQKVDRFDHMLRGFLTTDGKLIVWHPYNAMHSQVAEHLGLTKNDVVGIYLWVDPNEWHYAGVQVTDFTRGSKWQHNPELADWIRQHPAWWMDEQYIDISYYDEDVVGPWEEL